LTFGYKRKYGVTMSPVTTVGNDGYAVFDPINGPETVTLIQYIPNGSLSGANTNSRTINVYNRNATDGTGTTLIATLALVSGVNLVDNVAKTIPLSGTAANLLLTASQVVEVESLHVGTGIADPGGRFVMTTALTLS
jgi:hypothetical protein